MLVMFAVRDVGYAPGSVRLVMHGGGIISYVGGRYGWLQWRSVILVMLVIGNVTVGVCVVGVSTVGYVGSMPGWLC